MSQVFDGYKTFHKGLIRLKRDRDPAMKSDITSDFDPFYAIIHSVDFFQYYEDTGRPPPSDPGETFITISIPEKAEHRRIFAKNVVPFITELRTVRVSLYDFSVAVLGCDPDYGTDEEDMINDTRNKKRRTNNDPGSSSSRPKTPLVKPVNSYKDLLSRIELYDHFLEKFGNAINDEKEENDVDTYPIPLFKSSPKHIKLYEEWCTLLPQEYDENMVIPSPEQVRFSPYQFRTKKVLLKEKLDPLVDEEFIITAFLDHIVAFDYEGPIPRPMLSNIMDWERLLYETRSKTDFKHQHIHSPASIFAVGSVPANGKIHAVMRRPDGIPDIYIPYGEPYALSVSKKKQSRRDVELSPEVILGPKPLSHRNNTFETGSQSMPPPPVIRSSKKANQTSDQPQLSKKRGSSSVRGAEQNFETMKRDLVYQKVSNENYNMSSTNLDISLSIAFWDLYDKWSSEYFLEVISDIAFIRSGSENYTVGEPVKLSKIYPSDVMTFTSSFVHRRSLKGSLSSSVVENNGNVMRMIKIPGLSNRIRDDDPTLSLPFLIAICTIRLSKSASVPQRLQQLWCVKDEKFFDHFGFYSKHFTPQNFMESLKPAAESIVRENPDHKTPDSLLPLLIQRLRTVFRRPNMDISPRVLVILYRILALFVVYRDFSDHEDLYNEEDVATTHPGYETGDKMNVCEGRASYSNDIMVLSEAVFEPFDE